jgi:hypothetical protein
MKIKNQPLKLWIRAKCGRAVKTARVVAYVMFWGVLIVLSWEFSGIVYNFLMEAGK